MNQPDTSKPIRGYEITVQGSYIAVGEKGRFLKRYANEVFELPEHVTYPEGRMYRKIKDKDGNVIKKTVPKVVTVNAARVAKHYIRKYLLPHRLEEKYEDFHRIRTMNITKRERTMVSGHLGKSIDQLDIMEMSESQLAQFVAVKDLTPAYKGYIDLADMRCVVRDEWEAKKAEINALQAHSNKNRGMLDEPTDLRITNKNIQDAGQALRDDSALEAYGALTESDRVPVDQQDPWADMV